MSTRRKPGDVVMIGPGEGFLDFGVPLRARIGLDGSEPCMRVGDGPQDCHDPDCQEWATLWTVPDADEQSEMLCHVGECRMQDAISL